MGFATESEALFAAYLDDRGLTYEYEREFGGRPLDFFVTHPTLGAVVCEVTEITTMEPAGWVDPYRAAREKIKEKQKQGRALTGEFPYVIVLRFAVLHPPVDMIVTGAMYGDIGVTIPIDPATGGPPPGAEWQVAPLGGGRMQPERNTTISAIAVIEQFNPTKAAVERAIAARLPERPSFEEAWRVTREEYARPRYQDDARLPRLDVFHNLHAAMPVPREFFAGPHDALWDLAGDAYTRTWTGDRFGSEVEEVAIAARQEVDDRGCPRAC